MLKTINPIYTMKFEVGDKVLLKHTQEEGVVMAFIGDDVAEVLVNGTTFPVYIDCIDHPYLKWFTEKKKANNKPTSLPEIKPEKIAERPAKVWKGIFLSFYPIYKDNGEEIDFLKIYLLNETSVNIDYCYEMVTTETQIFKHNASLHAFGNVLL
ncbi:MAG: hypothetical protein EBX41_04810, partial [Chitinophagia bacterium]|nr:hypothetical protein [Chitinophagia bacterium]